MFGVVVRDVMIVTLGSWRVQTHLEEVVGPGVGGEPCFPFVGAGG